MREELADYKGRVMVELEKRAHSLQSQVDKVRRQLQHAGRERDELKVSRRED